MAGTTFIHDHASDIAAIDMLTVWTFAFQRLFAFVALAHDRRRILHIEVTDHPTALWLSLQIAAAFEIETPKFLVRDNDRAYGMIFRRKVRAMGVRDRPTQPHSPWQNGHVERLIGSIRRECLDHAIILNAQHLRRVLNAYADYYNFDRTHLALAKDSPHGRGIERQGRIISRLAAGGLHRRYTRVKPK